MMNRSTSYLSEEDAAATCLHNKRIDCRVFSWSNALYSISKTMIHIVTARAFSERPGTVLSNDRDRASNLEQLKSLLYVGDDMG